MGKDIVFPSKSPLGLRTKTRPCPYKGDDIIIKTITVDLPLVAPRLPPDPFTSLREAGRGPSYIVKSVVTSVFLSKMSLPCSPSSVISMMKFTRISFGLNLLTRL